MQKGFPKPLLQTHMFCLMGENYITGSTSHSFYFFSLFTQVEGFIATMQATPRLFKTLTNFTLAEFDELTLLMTPTIMRHAQSTCEHHIQVLDLGFTLKF